MEPLDLADPVGWAGRCLTACGVESPRLEAQLLLALALGITRTSVTAGLYSLAEGAAALRFQQLVDSRCRREPLAYLRGTQEFYGLEFEVNPAVLIPRPETELLVDFAMERLRIEPPVTTDARASSGFVLADVGTGSGCIAIATLANCPAARGIAVDLSAAALATAARNAARHLLDSQLRFVRSDLLSGAAAGRFDLILSNPPYIPSEEVADLQPEVRDSEPWLALDGGPDGLGAYRRLAKMARRCLKPHGSLAVEMGQGQASAVAAIFAEAGLSKIEIRRDLAGIERMAAATHLLQH